jgi:hypothetical protein
MIHAKEARNLTITSEKSISEALDKIEVSVRSACSHGWNNVEIIVPAELMATLMDKLISIDYKCKQTHTQGIRIEW